MDDPRFDELTFEVVSATFRWLADRARMEDESLSQAIERVAPGHQLDGESLVQLRDALPDATLPRVLLSHLIDIGEAQILEWHKAAALADDLGLQGFETARELILVWMRDAAAPGHLLGEPPLSSGLAPDGWPVEEIELNPNIAAIVDKYIWYWSRYIMTQVDSGNLLFDATPDLMQLQLLAALVSSRESQSLAYSLGLLHGTLAERERHDSVAPNHVALLRSLERIERTNTLSFHLQAGMADRLRGVEETLAAVEALFLDAVSSFD